MENLIQSVYTQITEIIKSNQIDVNSPFSIITKSMEVISTLQELNGHQKKALLLRTLKDIAAGTDRVAGTSDDVIPAKVIEEITKMMDSGLIDDYVKIILDVAQGKFTFARAVDVAAKTVPFCFSLCGRKTSV
jgi:hypothetical protein